MGRRGGRGHRSHFSHSHSHSHRSHFGASRRRGGIGRRTGGIGSHHFGRSRRRFGGGNRGGSHHVVIPEGPQKYKVSLATTLDRKVFYPGNLVTGSLRVEVTTPFPMAALRVKFAGKEQVRYGGCHKDTSMFVEHLITIHGPSAHEMQQIQAQQLQQFQAMLQAGNEPTMQPQLPPSIQVEPGVYTYPFSFVLPPVCPSSFSLNSDDAAAEVLYYVKGVLEITDDLPAENTAYLDILNPVPLVQYHGIASAPVRKDFVDNVASCCCFGKGQVQILVHSAQVGYSADRDEVSLQIKVDALSCKADAASLCVNLIQSVKILKDNSEIGSPLFAKRSTAQCQCDVKAGSQGVYAVTLPLQPWFPPTIRLYHSVTEYYIEGVVVMAGWTSNAKFGPVPIHIVQSIEQQQGLFQPFAFDNPAQFQRVGNKTKVYRDDDEAIEPPKVLPSEFAYVPPPQAMVPLQPAAPPTVATLGQNPAPLQQYSWMPPPMQFAPANAVVLESLFASQDPDAGTTQTPNLY